MRGVESKNSCLTLCTYAWKCMEQHMFLLPLSNWVSMHHVPSPQFFLGSIWLLAGATYQHPCTCHSLAQCHFPLPILSFHYEFFRLSCRIGQPVAPSSGQLEHGEHLCVGSFASFSHVLALDFSPAHSMCASAFVLDFFLLNPYQDRFFFFVFLKK